MSEGERLSPKETVKNELRKLGLMQKLTESEGQEEDMGMTHSM